MVARILDRHAPSSTIAMQVLTGTVVEGKVVLDEASLPDGAVVTVFAEQPSEALRLSPRLQAELEAAIDEADREEGISGEKLLGQLESTDELGAHRPHQAARAAGNSPGRGVEEQASPETVKHLTQQAFATAVMAGSMLIASLSEK